MYHNSATPPFPACYDDTCQPHQHLDMLSFSLAVLARRWDWWFWSWTRRQDPRKENIFGSKQCWVVDYRYNIVIQCRRLCLIKNGSWQWFPTTHVHDVRNRHIVGPDILIECVLNHVALSPKWVADDLTADWIWEYNKQNKFQLLFNNYLIHFK
jgi:hypothetical protein